MNKIDLKNIKRINFVFENCEEIRFPIECFKDLEIICSDLENYKGYLKSIKCKIIDDINVEVGLYNKTTSPIQRINKYDDITHIYLYDNENNEIKLEIPWYYENEYNIPKNNYNQHSKLISYKEIELYIAENSREYTLEEALEELKDGDIIIDTNGNEYEICEDNITGEKYLNTILKQSLLKEVFTKKDVINNETSNKNNKHYCNKCNKPLSDNITYNKLLEDKNEYLIVSRCLWCKTLNMYSIKQPLKDNM